MVAMEISTDDVHDVKALPALVEGAGRRVQVAEVIGDGAYNSGDVYEFLGNRGIEVVVKPRRNARLGSGPPGRRRAVALIRELGEDAWAKLTGYGRRWAVETSPLVVPLPRRLPGLVP